MDDRRIPSFQACWKNPADTPDQGDIEALDELSNLITAHFSPSLNGLSGLNVKGLEGLELEEPPVRKCPTQYPLSCGPVCTTSLSQCKDIASSLLIIFKAVNEKDYTGAFLQVAGLARVYGNKCLMYFGRGRRGLTSAAGNKEERERLFVERVKELVKEYAH